MSVDQRASGWIWTGQQHLPTDGKQIGITSTRHCSITASPAPASPIARPLSVVDRTPSGTSTLHRPPSSVTCCTAVFLHEFCSSAQPFLFCTCNGNLAAKPNSGLFPPNPCQSFIERNSAGGWLAVECMHAPSLGILSDILFALPTKLDWFHWKGDQTGRDG